jgi:lipopolysaccharide/colanic/teichoic acid biosynthesis glycosyltransferase
MTISQQLGKRLFDTAVSGVALLTLSPVLALIALAIRLDSDGPAIFRQERVGMHGRVFRIHKFRTLRIDSAGAPISPTGDPRVTRLGALLRRTKLDELPQLWDVFLGRMSLVGPRPELAQFVAMWPSAERDLILSVRPGITDPASIELRNEADELAAADDPESYYVMSLLPRKAAIYADYVRNRTFVGDLFTLVRTLRTVIAD